MALADTIFDLIEAIRAEIKLHHPELISIFETYAAEAVFGRQMIDADLKQLQPAASIIEVGAGSLILSCQLLREGYQITALEPIGEGFNHFRALQDVVLKVADNADKPLAMIDSPAEQLNVDSRFDYAFSINVMEHVSDEKQVITNVLKALKTGAKYRFICPNYTFPYEPHFNIPTLFSKPLTEKVFKKRILSHQSLADPWGTWQSLNWISVLKVKKIIEQSNNSSVMFSKNLLHNMLERAVKDQQFSNRRSGWMNAIFKGVVSLRLHKLTVYIPAMAQPVIDCVVLKEH